MRNSSLAVMALFGAFMIIAEISTNALCAPYTTSYTTLPPTDLLAGNLTEKDPNKRSNQDKEKQERGEAYSLFRAQRFAEAIDRYRRLTSASSASFEDHYWLGESYYHQNKFKEAASEFQQTVNLNPTFDAARVRLVEAYLAGRNTTEAASACTAALSVVTDRFSRQQLETLNKVTTKKGPLFPSLSMKESVETPNNSKRRP